MNCPWRIHSPSPLMKVKKNTIGQNGSLSIENWKTRVMSQIILFSSRTSFRQLLNIICSEELLYYSINLHVFFHYSTFVLCSCWALGVFQSISLRCWDWKKHWVATPNIGFCLKVICLWLKSSDINLRLQLPLRFHENLDLTDPLNRGSPHALWINGHISSALFLSSTWDRQVSFTTLHPTGEIVTEYVSFCP